MVGQWKIYYNIEKLTIQDIEELESLNQMNQHLQKFGANMIDTEHQRHRCHQIFLLSNGEKTWNVTRGSSEENSCDYNTLILECGGIEQSTSHEELEHCFPGLRYSIQWETVASYNFFLTINIHEEIPA